MPCGTSCHQNTLLPAARLRRSRHGSRPCLNRHEAGPHNPRVVAARLSLMETPCQRQAATTGRQPAHETGASASWHGAGPRPHARKPHEGLGPGWWLAQRETVGEASHLPAVLASPTAGRRALCRQRPCGPWRGAPPRSNPTPGQRPPSRVPRSQSIPGDAAQILCATSQKQDGCRAGPSGPPRSLAGSNPPGGE